MKKKICILTPVYNEEKNIAVFYDRVKKTIAKIKDKYEFQLIFTDNCSTDSSAKIIKELAIKDKSIKLITLSKNFGRTNSQYAGLDNSNGDLYFMIDVDCEDPPELLIDFVKKLESGYDIVYGIRNRIKESFFLYLFGKIFYRLANLLSDDEVVLDMAEFSIFSDKVKKEIMKVNTNFPFIRGELASVGFKKTGIKYFRVPRKYGSSKFKFFDLLYFAIGGVLSTSTFFLRISAILGAILIPINLIFIIIYINNNNLADWLYKIVIVSNFSFVIFSLSFISIYLARIHKNLLGKPIYVIDSRRFRIP